MAIDEPLPGEVLLVTGPGGSGKSTLAARLADQLGWEAVSEDDHWVRAGWASGLRTPEQEAVVQAEVRRDLVALARSGRHAVLELILYREPPNPLTAYQQGLAERAITVHTVVLRPSVDEIIRRMTVRGRPTDVADLATRRQQAEWQLHCLRSVAVAPEWVIDPTGLTVDETVARCRALLGR